MSNLRALLADPAATLDAVARAYAATREEDWETVNRLIRRRWPRRLEAVKRMAEGLRRGMGRRAG